MVVLITVYRQDPALERLAEDSLGSPWTVSLFSRSLVLGCRALIRPSSPVADQVATNNLVAGHVSTTVATAMRSRLDHLVALLFHAVVQFAHQVIVRLVHTTRLRHRNRRQNAEHDRPAQGWRVGMRVILERDLCDFAECDAKTCSLSAKPRLFPPSLLYHDLHRCQV